MRKSVGLLWIGALVLVALAPLTGGDARAQSDPDAWTLIDLNLRAGPGSTHSVLTVLPPETSLVIEAHDGDLVWLLARTLDGVWRGWVASGYLRYREGFAAANLPASAETVSAPASAAPPPNSDVLAPAAAEAGEPFDSGSAPASGLIDSMTLVHATHRSEYYRFTYLSDGLRVTGFVGWPKADGPHPAIIYNRGGIWDAGALRGVEIIPLVESGYVGIATNYRGNGGSEGLETFGWDDVNDVLNLISVLQSLPNVDPWRIGMMGGSRGGMMTYLALKEETLRGQSNIRAAVTVGGLADLFLWAEQNPDLTREIYMAVIGAMPAQNPDAYVHRSATYWPELINAPLLLLHGEADTTVPVLQSQRLRDALKAAGKDVTLVTYPGDDHPLTGQLGGYPEALRFFERYLGGDGVDRQYDSHWDDIRAVNQWFWENQP